MRRLSAHAGGGLYLRVASCVAVGLFAGFASAEPPPSGFLEVESFRSASHPIPMQRRSAADAAGEGGKAEQAGKTERCRAMPVVPDDESASLRIRIACGDSLAGDLDWSSFEALAFVVERPDDTDAKGQLMLSAGGETYRVRASFFRLSDRVATRPPPCSALGEQRRKMAATQGSGQVWCDPDR